MSDTKIKYDRYLSNLESVLEEVVTVNFKYHEIKENFLPHIFSKFRQFSENNYVEQTRIEFVEIVFQMIDNIKSKLSDIKIKNIDERNDILTQLKITTKLIFPDVIIESKKPLTTNEKVIILEYLGILKLLDSDGVSQKNIAQILELLLEKSFDNLKESIRNRNGKIKVTGSVKNDLSLNSVKSIAEKLKFKQLTDKVNADIVELNVIKQKKG